MLRTIGHVKFIEQNETNPLSAVLFNIKTNKCKHKKGETDHESSDLSSGIND